MKHLLRPKVMRRRIDSRCWLRLSYLLESGVSLSAAIMILQGQHSQRSKIALWRAILDKINSGCSFYNAVSGLTLLDAAGKSCINSGESSGRLAGALKNLASMETFKNSIKKSIKKIFYYPAVVLFCTVLVLVLFVGKILPSILDVFMQSYAGLPASTKFLLSFCNFLQHSYLFILLAVLLAYVTFFLFEKNCVQVSKIIFKFSNRLKLLAKYREYVFLASITLCLDSGVSLLAAIRVAAASYKNLWLTNTLAVVLQDIESGQYFSAALRNNNIFSSALLKTVEIAENTGKMNYMLVRYNFHLQAELQQMVDDLAKLLQPVVMLLVSVIVGGAIVAIYMPLFNIGQNL